MNILLISHLQKGSGNLHTIERIRTYLSDVDYKCILTSPDEFNDEDELTSYVTENSIKLIIGLHAFRAGKLLQDAKMNYILIIGGTDVNEDYRNQDKMNVMTQSVLSSRNIIVFSDGLRRKVKELWPVIPQDKIIEIKQGVQTCPSTFSLTDYIQEHHSDVYTTDMAICLCVGSIRPVKNPLYLVQEFSELHQRRQNIVYVICGPVVDEEYGKLFRTKIDSLSGVIFIPGLSLTDAHAAIQQSFAYINCSNSEGMALAILEAMMLEVPVIVRNIDGNKDIVEHGVNGFVFSNPKQCIEYVEELLLDSNLRDNTVRSASEYVRREHGVDTERLEYCDVVKSCLE
ncbi:glycosyltransferase 1 domain-containing protein 1-like [Mytilus trossulus]|uniref:glycosyltransferase 1 domain-containing protein 1-like n=1 Tax=Mytilus trossulus TaxID=6551 RepID=UPI003006C4F4